MTENADNPELAQAATALEQLWHAHFPLSKAMGLSIATYDGIVLGTATPLALNTNIHNTAFAGSLYAVQAMTCWGLLYLQLQAHDLDASIIHADGNIQFAKTIEQDIVCNASFAGHESAIETLKATGKVRLEMAAQVIAHEQVASSFSGTYVARLNR